MPEIRYAVCCKSCGHIEDKAWDKLKEGEHTKRTDRPLTKDEHAPAYCQKCGNRNWQVPATADQLEAFDKKLRQEARAIELTKSDDFDGMFKIPDDFRASAEVKRALSNLLGPLEGEVLKAAQANILKVSRSGMQLDSLGWIDAYDRAVQRAIGKPKAAA